MISRFTLVALLAAPLSFGVFAVGVKLWRMEQAARAEHTATVAARAAGEPMALGDEQAIDLLSTALLHWQLCEGGQWSAAEGRLLTTARTVAARKIDPEDPAVDRAVEASVKRQMRAVQEQGQAAWCAAARTRLDQKLS